MLYLFSEGFILEKKEIGCHCPLTYCWSTAPTAESDASVVRLVKAFGFRCTSKVASARDSLIPIKAWVEVLSHEKCSVIEVRSELSGSIGSWHNQV